MGGKERSGEVLCYFDQLSWNTSGKGLLTKISFVYSP